MLVTGGAGFIGSRLSETLLQLGARVTVLDNFSTGRADNLTGIKDQITLIRGDIRSDTVLADAVKGCDYVFHQAAIPSVVYSFQNPVETHEVNVIGSLKVLLSAKRTGVRRVVFASSSAVYGNSDRLPLTEETPPQPQSPYALTKSLMEQIAVFGHRILGVDTVCLRYFNVYGPRQDPRSPYSAVIPRFIDCLLTGKRPIIYGDGLQTRDFVFVDDCVRANILACLNPHAAGKVLNVGSGHPSSVQHILFTLGRIIGEDPNPIYDKARIGDVRHSVADVTTALKLIGFHAGTSLEDGLTATVNWFRVNLRAS